MPLFPLYLNLPIKNTPREIVYSANFTGPTETEDLRILHRLLPPCICIQRYTSLSLISLVTFTLFTNRERQVHLQAYNGWYRLQLPPQSEVLSGRSEARGLKHVYY